MERDGESYQLNFNVYHCKPEVERKKQMLLPSLRIQLLNSGEFHKKVEIVGK
jgi:hypothetical protein